MRAVWACRPRENLTVTIPGSADSTSPTPTSSRPSAMTASSTARRYVSRSLVVAINGYLPEWYVVVRGRGNARDVDALLAHELFDLKTRLQPEICRGACLSTALALTRYPTSPFGKPTPAGFTSHFTRRLRPGKTFRPRVWGGWRRTYTKGAWMMRNRLIAAAALALAFLITLHEPRAVSGPAA